MSQQVLTVFGATGQQGSSVIKHVLSDAELSQTYRIRAVTRDTNSEKVKAIKDKTDVVQGDLTDRSSLESVLAGTHAVFIITTPAIGPDALEIEFNIGKTIADVAVQQGAKYIIFSTLPAVDEVSEGKYPGVTPFGAKAKIERYIQTLPVKSAFFSGGFFMENFHTQSFLNPVKGDDGTYILARPVPSSTKLPYISGVEDIGKFVGAILASPEKYAGRKFCAAQGLYTLEEIAGILSRTSKKPVVYKQISREEFAKTIPFMVEVFLDVFGFIEEYGYFGPGTDEQVAWAARQVPERLSTLEEFLAANPVELV